MQKFKYELHAHTNAVSCCANVTPEEAVELYIAVGYAGMVITDHMYDGFVEQHGGAMRWDDVVENFLKGYRAAQAAIKDRPFQVFLGMELRFRGHNNDYLVYGITEEYLRSCGDITALSAAQFFESIGGKGIYIAQAHPFRNWMTVLPPNSLHGVEIANGCVRHESRNHMAALWAETYGLVGISGSDSHQLGDEGRGGVLLEKQPKDSQELADMIFRQKNFELILP